MKRALALAVVLGIAFGALAAGARLAPTATYHYDLTNCDGGVGVTLPGGDYLVAYKDEGVYLCVNDAGCAVGGQWNPANLVLRLNFGGANGDSTAVSCRSDAMTGDVSLNLIVPGT